MTSAEHLEQRLKELSTLHAIGEILNAEVDFGSALRRSLDRLVDLLDLSTGWVFLSRVSRGDAHGGGFRVAATCNLPPALAVNHATALCRGRCNCQWRFQQGSLDTGVNIVECSRLEQAEGERWGLELHASVPLLGRQGPEGILNLAAPGHQQFDSETLAFLTAVGRQLGVAYERSKLLETQTQEARYSAALEERQRLARDMHDSVSQLLFAADLALQAGLESGEVANLKRGTSLVEDAMDELQALVEVLRPADLSDGLAAALGRLARRTGTLLTVHLEVEELSLDPAKELALYRIAQEALHNVLKHASASTVKLVFRGAPEAGTALTVEDDGVGMPPRAPAGFGLSNVRSRVEALGGRLEFGSGEHGGFRLEVRLP